MTSPPKTKAELLRMNRRHDWYLVVVLVLQAVALVMAAFSHQWTFVPILLVSVVAVLGATAYRWKTVGDLRRMP